MLLRLIAGTLALTAPAVASAGSLADTHEQVTVPGKQLIGQRPLVRQSRAPICHPDWSKATSCRSVVTQKSASVQQAAARTDMVPATEAAAR